MISPDKKYVPIAILFGLLVAIGGIVWYGIMPLRQSLGEKMRGIQEYYAGKENRERQIGKLPELKAQYDAIIENEKALDILVAENEVVDFVKILETLAHEMNVEMSISSKDGGKVTEPKKPAPKPAPSKDAGETPAAEKNPVVQKAVTIADTVPFDRYLTLSVTVDGRYDDIVAFLRKMETLPFGIDTARVEMKKKDDGNAAPVSGGNPFTVLGDGGEAVGKTGQDAGQDPLEAVFDILVYIKKTDL